MRKALIVQKLKKNAPTILTCVGAVGVVATSVLTAKATVKATEILKEAEKEKGEPLTEMEVVKVATPSYIPAIISGAATIACIFGANVLNKRSQATLMSAYALLDNSYKEYKSKVNELYGETADTDIKTAIAKDKYEEIEPFDEDDGKQLFYDMFSERYFEATMENVLSAQYSINRDAATHGGVYLNEFYEMVGAPTMPEYDEFGWSASQVYDMCWNSWIEFVHTKTDIGDGLECTFINMSPEPTMDFLDY